jgi:hypothetical protein
MGGSATTKQRAVGSEVLVGGLGGAAGTLLMSLCMLLARRLGAMGSQPPELITAAAMSSAGLPRDRETQDALSVAAHFAFGIAGGSAFALIAPRFRLPLPLPVQGAIYATGIWAVSYAGIVPALGIMPPPDRDRPDRPLIMVLVHWIYGAVLGAVVRLDSQ